MKELGEILKKISNLAPDEKVVLATVVDVQGSAYRRPGAKMLICANGDTFGTVSGGCLEADVLERAKKVLETNKAQVFVYDTTKHEDSIFSLNMGCRGVIRILFEPLADDYFNRLKSSFEKRQTFVNATIIETNKVLNLPIGKRFFFESDETLTAQLKARMAEVLINEHSTLQSFEIENETVEFFFEVIKPPLALYVFGAGADAVPLYEIAKTLGWQVSIIDHRAAYATNERFPEAYGIFVMRPENLDGKLTLDAYSVAVVMTHNYEKDKQIQKFLLATNAVYIGALGPKKRTEKLLAEIGETWPANLYAPIGLDIGAETPEEIALAIIAEIQCVLKVRSAGFLRDKKAGIHSE